MIHGIWGESRASPGAVARVRRWPSRAVARVRRGSPNRAAVGALDQGHRCGITIGFGGFFGEVSER
ncbi:MAG: hypothetical protein EB138_02395 [Actinobacteria bacterium]|nr:hypothetical protein [Acidimicrobiia bacterium]NCZ67388.1 hypothetical protein [Acidimicrobiia bacterium]NDE52306.1 hypothetical protein [Actinomycetota bacterium]NDF71811.1 hypothetical protein [Actinomycetota bacterium]